ncbi:hypothetical protein M3202_07255 [Alkalihalobacillus oceani]|uniref:Uncharacterized protein n=1 Tax=Halalkalibacter oceani TaxID=1653776 RepID=A0A9X2DRL0_9BACI|nr:hypothetical protein [Halalkalibacter oceani]MCM3713878.1 hypothetical protein [Halalkalibacter oceani]
MAEKKPLWKKWWIWLIVVSFIILNILITNGQESGDSHEDEPPRLTDSPISTH